MLGKIRLDNKSKKNYKGGANAAAGNGRGQWHFKTERSRLLLSVSIFERFLCFPEFQKRRRSLEPMSIWLLVSQFA